MHRLGTGFGRGHRGDIAELVASASTPPVHVYTAQTGYTNKSADESGALIEYSENVETFACKQTLPCERNFVGKLNVFRRHRSQGL